LKSLKVVLTLLFFIAFAGSVYYLNNKMIKSTDNQIKLLNESMLQLKSEVLKAVPVPLGHWHHNIRIFMIKAQGGQVEENCILLIGDSITEGIYMDRISGLPVLNAGVGGAGVSFFNDNLKDILSTVKKPVVAVIALGVNDATLSIPAPLDKYVSTWIKQYESLVNQVRKAGAEPVLMTILPVEKDMPLGSKYFNTELIKKLNESIRDLSVKDKLILFDSNKTFSGLDGFIKKGLTIDGVHLTSEGYKIWKEDIVKGIKTAVDKKGLKSSAK
jgi:lysophospholipase L1-like esterase